MKFIPAALCISLVRSAAAESCPDELPGKVELNGAGLAFHYGILEDDQALCGKLVSDTEVWVGFAAQPEGIRQMIGAKSVIALPQANTVQQYMLNAKNSAGIVPTDSQTLTETTVTQQDGTTVATFKQPLSDNDLTLSSNNVYLLAKGFSNDLGYHVGRGFMNLDFETNVIISPTTANPTTYPSLQPSLKSSSPPSLKASSSPSMNSSSQPSLKSSSPPSLISSSQPSMNSSSPPSLKSSSPPSLNSSSHPSSQPTQNTTTQTSSKPSSPPSLGSTAAPSSVESTPLVTTTNTTTYPSSQPSNSPLSQSSSKPSSKPSIQSSSSPSSLPSAEPSSLPSNKLSSLPSSELQTSGTSTPSSASPSQLTSSPLSLKPSANPSRFLTDNSQPVPITEDKDPTSSSQGKVFSMGMALSKVACVLLATASW